MTRFLSALCLVLWLAGCATEQTTSTTAEADTATATEAKKDCSQNYRGTASNDKQCSNASCPDHH